MNKLRFFPILLSIFLTTAAYADQDVKSNDRMWNAHAKMSNTLGIKQVTDATIDVTPVGSAKGCPSLDTVVFEMPAHGHGGDAIPAVMNMGACKFHVTNLSASMGGDWRLRLVLKSGDKSSYADFTIPAK